MESIRLVVSMVPGMIGISIIGGCMIFGINSEWERKLVLSGLMMLLFSFFLVVTGCAPKRPVMGDPVLNTKIFGSDIKPPKKAKKVKKPKPPVKDDCPDDGWHEVMFGDCIDRGR